MYLALTDEQSFLQEAATAALARCKTVEAARAALDGEPYTDLWPVAVDAGWTGLLVSEDADGVGLGAYEALLILEACGRTLADARLLGHLPATALLEAAGADAERRGALARGERRAALVCPSSGDRPGKVAVALDGSGVAVLDGAVPGVLDADGADVLVVLGRDADGTPVLSVVDAGADGVTVTPKRGYDGSRALANVAFAGARATALTLPADVAPSLGRDLQRALLAAESVGSADGALQMATAYAKDRIAFGRAIGSYQAIKHKLVEMLRLTDGARSLLVATGSAWDAEGREGFTLAANAARTAAADALDYAAPENIFIHGGIGATWEGDAMLYYRRAELSRRLSGGAEAAAATVATALLAG
ncbi:acyl-CoA/acyl-ACP dehydrogenase [Paraconexibacter antarcticus]|uniref:Acyl-CoA/acyl-ACP dehydrogenase n=1 Tax=Paraconexibacter antarcticus TaxID=2949664 RepID=A0ABY5DRW5_9ACTN|nr:acyl-CoA dehydrogenase family protein [Paraconexibacter antarcticus]UTI63676.1 acyl-CoA/acyl-ACP dehydrogenase [Paraconexibacter antarcticus]